MELVKLTEFLVKNIVKNPDMISVKQYDDEEFITIEVLVSSDDMGAVIGKGGMIANSIRTLIQASAHANNLGKVKVNFESF